MQRVNKVAEHPLYNYHLKKNIDMEKDRKFCHHNLQHFLDVARVAYIIALEEELDISKEIIYTTALLHDIGKWQQYLDGRDHAMASAIIAEEILHKCNFDDEEIQMILNAIKKHRKGDNLITPLERVLYEGDKKSRLCPQCSSIDKCKRFEDGKMPDIYY